jgi:hypothetical protein
VAALIGMNLGGLALARSRRRVGHFYPIPSVVYDGLIFGRET